MKAGTMAAALDQGLITPDKTFNDPGCMTFTDAPKVCNWMFIRYGTESMTQVLIHSANVGAAYVAHNILGAERYYPYLERFSFGQPTGIDGPEEAGSYLSPNDHNWTKSDLTRQAFGQGILVTPLQLTMPYEAISNGGVLVHSHPGGDINQDGESFDNQPRAEETGIRGPAAPEPTESPTQASVL